MARPASPTVSRRELANTLRHMRQQARKTLEEAAAALEVSAATLSRIETGVRVPRARDVKELCEFYGLTDATRIGELTALVADAKESGWWEAYSEVDEEYATLIGFEQAATSIEQFGSSVIPGLLQTEEYARVYLTEAIDPGRRVHFSDQDISKAVEVRGRRQELFARNPPLKYSAILDEATLRRTVGGNSVMREQISHLLNATETTGVEIRVLPLAHGAHPGQQGGFVILTMPQSQVSDVVYVDSLAGQLFLETTEELARHRRVFSTLIELSLDTEASQGALIKIRSDYE
jgi:transcriptional regulator with XRE-family HTH domain